jgi:hypothetical protein
MANEQNLKPFKKGDARINRKGRPKSFDELRALAKLIANEKIESKDGKTAMSRIELIMRQWAASGNDKLARAFVEYAYGKVQDELSVDVQGKIKVIEIIKDYSDGDPRPD